LNAKNRLNYSSFYFLRKQQLKRSDRRNVSALMHLEVSKCRILEKLTVISLVDYKVKFHWFAEV